MLTRPVSAGLRARRADLRGRGELRAGSHGDVIHDRPHRPLQHGDAAAGSDAGVGRPAR